MIVFETLLLVVQLLEHVRNVVVSQSPSMGHTDQFTVGNMFMIDRQTDRYNKLERYHFRYTERWMDGCVWFLKL